MELLDAILANTRSDNGPAIRSEQNDIGRINWVNGLSDPGELIRCGYLPAARRLAGEEDTRYQARIQGIVDALPPDEREIIAQSAVTACVKRASLDTTGGKVAVFTAGQPAWHGLGVNVAEAVASADAIRLAGLRWKALKLPVSFQVPGTGEWQEAAGSFAIVRDDSHAFLASVGSRYEPIQNEDAFGFLDKVLGEFGARYETAGSLYGGKKVWLQAHFPQSDFQVGAGDENRAFVLFSNSHDGSSAASIIATNHRVVCANTHRVALKDRKGGLSIRHTGSVKSKVRDAQAALGLAVQGFASFKDQAQVLCRAELPLEPFADNIFDIVLGVTAAKEEYRATQDALALAVEITAAEQKWQKLEEKKDNLIAEAIARGESGRCEPQGSAWAAYNAISETCDHGTHFRPKRGSESDRLSRRFESVTTGDADAVKQYAFAEALKSVR